MGNVIDKIKAFLEQVRRSVIPGAIGAALGIVVACGIGFDPLALFGVGAGARARELDAEREQLLSQYRATTTELTQSLRSAGESNAVAGRELEELGRQLAESRGTVQVLNGRLATGAANSERLRLAVERIATDAAAVSAGDSSNLQLAIQLRDCIRELVLATRQDPGNHESGTGGKGP